MILYVNGDSHAAGAEINNTYCFSRDDPKYPGIDQPHPENIPDSFGSVLAKRLGYRLWLDAISGSSNQRILRTTEKFLENNNSDVFLLICWSSFERQEQFIDGKYYQFSPGFDPNNHSQAVIDAYRDYVSSIDHDVENNRWHQTIWDFHLDLIKRNIKHLFFNSYMEFIIPKHERLDWENCFIGNYDHQETYWRWLESQGYTTVNDGYHYGADGHAAWADRLYNWLTDHQLL